MTWADSLRNRRTTLPALALAMLIALGGLLSLSSEDKQLSVYAPQATFTVRVNDRDGREYVDLFSVLEPISNARMKEDGTTSTITAGSIEATFVNGETMARVGRKRLTFANKLVVENGRVQVPLAALTVLLTELAGSRASIHESGRRLFVENTQTRFTVELTKGESSELVMAFPMRVSPSIIQDGNQIKLIFKKEPVIFGADNYSFTDPLIQGVRFEEKNGLAEIIVSATAPVMVTFADEGKMLRVRAAPAAPAVISSAPPPEGAPVSMGDVTPATPSAPSAPASPVPVVPLTNAIRYFVMIDPGHGGSDPGVKFSEKLNEKEITLALARRLRNELQGRGIPTVLLRDGDSTISYDQRAVATNGQRAALYIGLHAGGLGSGVRVYAEMMPDAEAVEGPFVPWDRAQESYRERSLLLSRVVMNEMSSKKISARTMRAPVPPLNAIAAPAIAVEVAPPALTAGADGLNKAAYQHTVIAALVNAIVNSRNKLEQMR
ncbi:MAG TPA: N-acetylmuramoyl-L-alanine amidase [Terriglobales bacterium]|nr:N-acetylmuramoyl-L-alanine amidase [Terriglobales bacterium]